MQGGGRRVSARQNEGFERLKLGFHRVDLGFQKSDFGLIKIGFGFLRFFARVGQFGAQREQVALNGFEGLPERLVFDETHGQTQRAVEFINVAIKIDKRVALAHARAIKQAGFAGVAGFGVDFHVC